MIFASLAFGEPCLQQFIDMFEHNVILTKIIWRLDSRKSFAINKLIVRNNTIKKWVLEGKSVQDIYPKGANIPIDELNLTIAQSSRGSIMEEDSKQEQEEDGEEGKQEESNGLGECPSSANHAAKTIFNEFKTKIDDKWKVLEKQRKRKKNFGGEKNLFKQFFLLLQLLLLADLQSRRKNYWQR